MLRIVSFVAVLSQVHSSTKWCNESFSCYNGEDISGETVNCGGYFSCALDTTITNTYNSDDYAYEQYINCGGSYSCYKSSSIISNGEHPDLNCNGLMSCAYISNISVLDYVYCNGEQSCIGSNIYYGNKLECNGFQSCKNVIATVRSDYDENYSEVRINSMLGAQNAVFYASPHINTNEFTFIGPYSGVNTTVVCIPGTYCVIDCWGTEACNHNFTISCDTTGYDSSEDSASECDINVYCSKLNDTWAYGSQCWDQDTGIFYSSHKINGFWNNGTGKYYEIPQFPSLWNESTGEVTLAASSLSNSIDICGLDGMTVDGLDINQSRFDSNTIICADYEECLKSNVVPTGNGDICCLGERSCYNTSSIVMADKGMIRCDGEYSCAKSMKILDGRNGNNLYFTAYRAAGDGDGNNMHIIGNGNNDIYCMGRESCYYASNISNIHNAYLMGSRAGYTSYFGNIKGNVYVYGYWGYPHLYNVEGSIYCAGEYSCTWSNIENVGGDIYCFGRNTCYNTDISGQVNGTLYAVGPYAIDFSEIYARIDTMIIAGKSALSYTSITETKNIIAYGDAVMGYYAEIYSSDYWKELHVLVNQTHFWDYFEVTCKKGHSCSIICPYGCEVVLKCKGNCTLVGVTTVKKHRYHHFNYGLEGAEIAGAILLVIFTCCLVGYCARRANKNSIPQVVIDDDNSNYSNAVVGMVQVSQVNQNEEQGAQGAVATNTSGIVPVTKVTQEHDRVTIPDEERSDDDMEDEDEDVNETVGKDVDEDVDEDMDRNE